MEATELLTHDHDEVRALAKEFESAHERDDHDAMDRLAEQICLELDVHAAIEEEILYPSARELGDDEVTELVAESIQEHHVVKVLIRELRDLSDRTGEVFAAKTTVLIENVEHHASEEEEEMFPKLRELVPQEQREEWGARLEQAKSERMASAKPSKSSKGRR